MLPDQSQGNPQQVDPRLLMQMMMARRAQQGAIPGAAAPQSQTPQNPTQQATPQAGVPGAAQAPQSQPQSQGQAPQQGGAARQLSPASPTPFNGTFGDRKGVISQLVNSAEKGAHDKKAHEAEMYYNQINSFLASGQPDDQKKAQALLDDPKIRKVLKAGLDYVPLEEAPPPEALGIHQAVQKIQQKQNIVKKLQTLLTGGQKQGSAQQSPPGRAAIPQASQAAQGAYAEQQAKIGEQGALAKQHEATALAEKQKADAETMKAEADKIRAYAEVQKNKSLSEEASSHGKLYSQQAKELADTNPMKQRELQAHSNELNNHADYYAAMAKYAKNGKLPASKTQDLMKSQRADMIVMFKGYRSDNSDAKKDLAKNPWYRSDSRLQGLQDDAAKKAKDMAAGIAWYDGEGAQAVADGKMTPPEAAAKAYRIAGIDPPPASTSSNSDDNIPNRPQGVPSEAEWDPDTRTWSVQ